MGKALYRTYRSKSLDDVVGQEHVIKTLKRALETGSISHAYLLTGPRGVGKTSIARILAHEINGLPYDDDDSTHLDIIEIDAASNRRIDDIRDLRDKVHIAPTSSKYKVYIIDEVHMLTGESFNALLKTLEEPPAHVVFILATTEAHKLPETIISRTQRFTFRPIDQKQVVNHLKSIAKTEKISIDGDALELIAEHGDGSFRDSINLLDQARGHSKHITVADVQELLGMPGGESIQSIINAVAQSNSQTVVTNLANLQLHGHDATRISKQLAKVLRTQLLANQNQLSPQITMQLLTSLLDVPASPNPFRLLELSLLTACFAGNSSTVTIVPSQPTTTAHIDKTPTAQPSPKEIKPAVNTTPKKPLIHVEKSKAPKENITQEPVAVVDTPEKTIVVGSVDPAIWESVLNEVKKKYNTLYGIIRMAQVTQIDDGLRLSFKFAFHQKRVNEAKNKAIIITTVEQLTGVTIVLECIVAEVVEASAPAPIAYNPEPLPVMPPDGIPVENSFEENTKPDHTKALQDISNIFGGAEVLES